MPDSVRQGKGDVIYRQAAIDALHNYWRKRLDTLPTKKTEDGEVYADTKSVNKILEYNKALTNFIKALPSVQKKGQWLYDEEREATGIYAVCSCCDEKVYQCGEWLFCPRCGADMRKEGDANG